MGQVPWWLWSFDHFRVMIETDFNDTSKHLNLYLLDCGVVLLLVYGILYLTGLLHLQLSFWHCWLLATAPSQSLPKLPITLLQIKYLSDENGS